MNIANPLWVIDFRFYLLYKLQFKKNILSNYKYKTNNIILFAYWEKHFGHSIYIICIKSEQ